MMPVAHRKYLDRRDAGRQLALKLCRWKHAGAVVFALPRGGVPVAVEVAKELKAPLDLLYVRKIGAPLEPELALGAIVDGSDPDIVLNDAVIARLGVSQSVVDGIAADALKEVERRRRLYRAPAKPLMPTGRPAIVVDDGLATGASMRAAVKALRRRGATHVIVAVPVAPPDAVEGLEAEGAEVVCPLVTDRFFGVGAFYSDFHQLSDDDVKAALDEMKRSRAVAAPIELDE
jgi:putative phosphoribosyl transferase